VASTSLRFFFALCLLAATALTVIAGVPLGALTIIDLVSHGPDRQVWWVNVLGAGFVILSYFTAAVVIAPILWLLQSLRTNLFGWLLSGAAVGVVTYGSVGVFAALAFQLLGFNIIGYESTGDAWSAIGDFLPVSFILGILGGAYAWWQNGRKSLD
jgi:hypothetical protein